LVRAPWATGHFPESDISNSFVGKELNSAAILMAENNLALRG
jgi:hypothetical protein